MGIHFGASQVALVVKNPPTDAGDIGDMGSIPGSGRSPGGGGLQPTPAFLPGESQGQRSLAGYGPWGRRERGIRRASLITCTLLQEVALGLVRDRGLSWNMTPSGRKSIPGRLWLHVRASPC